MNAIPIPHQVSEQTKISQETGLMVLQVEPDSPAKKAGIAFGDVIVQIDDKPVREIPDLTQKLNEELIGKKTRLTVLRGEKLTTLTVMPSEAQGEEDD
jgi:S1-C subfamily serine protease